jgi:LppP/LprE lipoprotein
MNLVKVRCRLVWTRVCGIRGARRPAALVAAALLAAALSGCGSGDSTVAKTPQPATHPTGAPNAPAPPPVVGAAPTTSPAADPCAVNLADPAIARGVSELPHDPRSQQPWNPEPLAGNFNECAQLSAVIVKANTNAESPNTRAVMFHLGKLIPPQGVPDTYGFNGIDASQCTGDTVALSYSGGIGLPSVVKFRWNGNGVELIANAGA